MIPATIAVVLACTASIVRPFAPTWLFIALSLVSLCCSAFGLLLVRVAVKRHQLLLDMDRAFK